MCLIIENDNQLVQWRPAYADRAVRNRIMFCSGYTGNTETASCQITRVLDVFSQLFVRLAPLESISDDSFEWAVSRADGDDTPVWYPIKHSIDLVETVTLSAGITSLATWSGDYVRRYNETLDLSHCALLTDEERASVFMVPLDTLLQGRPFPYHMLPYHTVFLSVQFYTRRRLQRRSSHIDHFVQLTGALLYSPSLPHNIANEILRHAATEQEVVIRTAKSNEMYVIEIGNMLIFQEGEIDHQPLYLSFQCIVNQNVLHLRDRVERIELWRRTQQILLIASVPLESLDGIDLQITYWLDTHRRHTEHVCARFVSAGVFDITPTAMAANAARVAAKGAHQYAAATPSNHIGQSVHDAWMHSASPPPISCAAYGYLSEDYYGPFHEFCDKHVPTVELTHGEHDRPHHYMATERRSKHHHLEITCNNIDALKRQGIYLSVIKHDASFLQIRGGVFYHRDSHL
jgi:hypothetical protein